MSDVPISDPALTLYHALEDVGWQQSFDPGSLARGMGYARQGRVREGTRLERQGDLLVLRAQVDGSGRSRYGTNLAVDPGNPEMGVISDCSCPVGRQCKHAVAVIGTFIDEMEANGIPERDATARLEQRWEAWLAEFEAPGTTGIPVDRVEETCRLALFLDIDRDPLSPTLKVSPVWLRPSRQRTRGHGWVKPRAIQARSRGGLQPMPPAGWAPEQEEALELLLQAGTQRPYSVGNEPLWGVISQAFQARALWSLLESDTPPLLFYQKQTGTLLDVGPACQLTLAWVPDAEGNQYLQADIEPADVVSGNAIMVRAGRELCYLDQERGRIGRLSGDPELLRRLRYSPPLPLEMSGLPSGMVTLERLQETGAVPADQCRRESVTSGRARALNGPRGCGRPGTAPARAARQPAGAAGFRGGAARLSVPRPGLAALSGRARHRRHPGR
ncbi:SWIM zinc finger family protein [Halomonas jincaotanensis]|uniref:SWIM zinc finger family protein n=1 Tax=Halomonas jincaotanensis TaxID=2810616 RepID=UPI0029E7F711|nr:SWIM zinc finger family protein [Halomonas jincaotanensis]